LREAYTPPEANSSNGRIVPIQHPAESKANFGAEVYGIDLNHFTSADFELISHALHRYKLLVFKEQPEMLMPQQQYRLTSWYVFNLILPVLDLVTDIVGKKPVLTPMKQRAASPMVLIQSCFKRTGSPYVVSPIAQPSTPTLKSTFSVGENFHLITSIFRPASR
jgi:hypothetical protein